MNTLAALHIYIMFDGRLSFAEEISVNMFADFPVLPVLFYFLEHYLLVNLFMIYSLSPQLLPFIL